MVKEHKQSRQLSLSQQKRLAIALILPLFITFIFLLPMMCSNLMSDDRPSGFEVRNKSNDMVVTPHGIGTVRSDNSQSVLTLTFESISFEQKNADVNLVLEIPEEVLLNLRRRSDSSPVIVMENGRPELADKSSSPALELRFFLGAKTFGPSGRLRWPNGQIRENPDHLKYDRYTFSLQDTLYAYKATDRTGRLSFKFTLPMFAQPELFPDDWYYAEIGEWILLSDDLELCEHSKCSDHLPSILGGIYLPPAWSMKERHGPTSLQRDASGQYIMISRDISFSMWSYGIIFIPVLLILFMAISAIHSGNRPLSFDIFPQIAAAMIAIIPIRQVLVPPEIIGITRMDMFFGLELFAIVGVALGIKAVDLWSFSSRGLRARGLRYIPGERLQP